MNDQLIFKNSKDSLNEERKEKVGEKKGRVENIVKSNTYSKDYREVFKYIPEPSFILDSEGVVQEVNKAGAALIDFEFNDIIGKSFTSFISISSLPKDFLFFDKAVFNKRNYIEIECEINRVNGISFTAILKNQVILNEQSEFKYFLITVNDISKWKEQARKIELAHFMEKELNTMKSRFITMVSHEFRTPLSSILLSTELIEKYKSENEDANRSEHLSKIKMSVQRLNETLMNFLSTNKIRNGEIKNIPQLFSLGELITKIKLDFEKKIVDQKIIFIRSKEIFQVNLDANLLEICLLKLIGNALKYSSKNGIVEIELKYNSFDNVIIFIRDKGIGIPESDKKNIFTKFFKGRNAENIEGNGLGLYDVKRMVSIMGGSIDFTSEENIGTIFRIEFKYGLATTLNNN